ncbi:MAG: hypothetical protein AB2746_08840, partial [Candidatus Thiodiazotropha taylori]
MVKLLVPCLTVAIHPVYLPIRIGIYSECCCGWSGLLVVGVKWFISLINIKNKLANFCFLVTLFLSLTTTFAYG